MTDAPGPAPIEPEIRTESPPDDTILVVRAGPMTVEKLLEHALRQAREFTYRGEPMYSISADATVAGWTVDSILQDRLWSRTSYATVAVGALRLAGFELLPTFDVPHYDVILRAATPEAAGTLVALFGPVARNPYRRRGEMATGTPVQIDIPCDVQQVDGTGFVWMLLDEARDPSVITAGAIVIAADEEDPVLARVVDLVPGASGTIVHLEILPGDPLDYADALARSHLPTA